MDDLIKMYEQYKKAAKDREEYDVMEYYYKVIVNLRQQKHTQSKKDS